MYDINGILYHVDNHHTFCFGGSELYPSFYKIFFVYQLFNYTTISIK